MDKAAGGSNGGVEVVGDKVHGGRIGEKGDSFSLFPIHHCALHQSMGLVSETVARCPP